MNDFTKNIFFYNDAMSHNKKIFQKYVGHQGRIQDLWYGGGRE
jgi:hypothetical protein